jgi:hypothetical protein
MPTSHTVQLGECMGSLAKRHGFSDHKALYDDGANATLKSDRPNPNVLAEGDVVTIPDKAEKKQSVATGAQHKFTLKRLKTLLRIVMQDEAGTALASKKYRLTIDGGEPLEGATAGDGKIEHPIDAAARSAELELWLKEGEGIDGYLFRLELGSLEHESSTRGCQARLINLGFDCGGMGGTLDAPTHDALRGFQKKNGLTENGNLDAPTRTKLRQLHEGA